MSRLSVCLCLCIYTYVRTYIFISQSILALARETEKVTKIVKLNLFNINNF